MDANEFIVVFRDAIELSIPHIYLSALPGVHETSKIAKNFRSSFPSTVKLTVKGRERQRLLLELRGHTNGVKSVAFSADGTLIASGSGDHTIRLWNAKTGEEVMNPLKGHSDSVQSVAFSADGTLIVSGSLDHTIRMWDAKAGEVRNCFPEHTNFTNSIAFSLDNLQHVDNWLIGPAGELLLWIPPEYCSFLLFHPCLFIIAPFTVIFDFSCSCHGLSWTMCSAVNE